MFKPTSLRRVAIAAAIPTVLTIGAVWAAKLYSLSTQDQDNFHPLWAPNGTRLPALHFYTRGRTLDLTFDFSARQETVSQSVSVLWTHAESKLRTSQKIPVGYFPTAVCHGHQPNELYVAGKGEDGLTRIERWELVQPTVIYAVPPPGGAPTVGNLLPQGVKKISTIYSSATPGMNVVTAMGRIMDDSNDMFVKFADRWNLYRADAYARPMTFTLVASGSPDSGAPLIDESLASYHSTVMPIRINDGSPNGQHRYMLFNAGRTGQGTMFVADDSGSLLQLIPISNGADWAIHGFPNAEDRLPAF